MVSRIGLASGYGVAADAIEKAFHVSLGVKYSVEFCGVTAGFQRANILDSGDKKRLSYR